MTLLVTLVVFPLVGLAAALLLRFPVRSFAFCFLTGVGVQGTVLYVLGAIGIPLHPVTIVLVPVALWSAGLLARRGTLLRRAESPALQGERHVLATVVFAIPLIVLLLAATVMPTRDYDGRVTWLPKARAIALEQSIDGPFFHGERGLNLHNRYPLLLPLDAATVMALTGDTRNEAARWLYVLIPIAALLVMRSMLGNPWIAAAVAWLPILFSIEGGALAAYNDLALAAFVGVAVLSLLAEQEHVAGWFAAFAVLTKNEGAVLAFAILLAALVVRRLRVQMVVVVAAAIALVAYWRTQVPAAYDEQYEVLASSLSLHRVPAALLAIAKHACDWREWGVFWIAVLIAIVITRKITAPLVVIVVALAAYTFALAVTSWPIEELAKVAANRLLLHLIVPGACAIAMAGRALAVPVTPK